MPSASDVDILEALDLIVREQRMALAHLARHEGLTAEDAIDCVQDGLCTFLTLALRGELPSRSTEHVPLLSGIVRSTARNRRRRHHLTGHEVLDDEAQPDGAALSTDALLAQAEEVVRLHGCVNRLCEVQRTVVMMRLLEERPGEDVAAALGIRRGYVDVLLHRAKASLRVCMIEHESR